MEQHEGAGRRFGTYLRKVREGRRLSLDAVEELSAGYAERVTKSHLSRIENGQAVPSFARLYTLSRIYGVPISSLAERFEVDLRRQQIPADLAGKPEAEALAEAGRLRMAGRYSEALAVYEAVLDSLAEQPEEPGAAERISDLRLQRINCLWHLGSYGLAKEECEELLSGGRLAPDRELLALQNLVMCCVSLGRFKFALIILERAEKQLGSPDAPLRMAADITAIRAFVHTVTGVPESAAESFAAAMEKYTAIGNGFEACRCQINLGYALLECAQATRARTQLEAGLRSAESAGYDRLKALALGHLALLSLREGSLAAAESYALRSNSIARPREYLSLLFRNCYCLWKAARAKGDEAGVRANERTLRAYVSRVEDYMPEVQEFRAYLAGGRA